MTHMYSIDHVERRLVRTSIDGDVATTVACATAAELHALVDEAWMQGLFTEAVRKRLHDAVTLGPTVYGRAETSPAWGASP